jgi:hypothetical protein
MFMGATLVAAANGDTLFSHSVTPVFTPGAFTGLTGGAISINAFSVAAFTSPADTYGLNIGTITGTGATNASAIRFAAPTGATNNYLLLLTGAPSTFSVTGAGAMLLGSTLAVTGIITATATIGTYNNVATAGLGIVANYGSGRVTAKVNVASGTIATYTPAADGLFEVGANVLVTAASACTFTVTVTYTDEGNTARTLTLTFSQITGTFLTAITNVTGTGAYEGVPLRIRAKGANAITIQTAAGGTYTGVTYNASADITQLAA